MDGDQDRSATTCEISRCKENANVVSIDRADGDSRVVHSGVPTSTDDIRNDRSDVVRGSEWTLLPATSSDADERIDAVGSLRV